MNQATYCPEDNKLRLYVGRVPRPEYEALRRDGWISTPKQDCDFVAVWTPSRYATALEYGDGYVGDEDQSPEDRAADRAERFAGYRDKREGEALGMADSYDRGPQFHGYQSQARADRAATRHDRIAGHACDAWSKAEYWQRRTAGVIGHALYSSRPDVRMGRIKTLEAEQRKHAATLEDYKERFSRWQQVAAEPDAEKARKMALHLANYSHGYHYQHPRPESATDYMREHGTSLHSLMTYEKDPISGAEAAALYLAGLIDPNSDAWQETSFMQWARHYELRLAYENQMLEAQGGRAAHVEMIAGGFIAGRQIQKVNKSPVTGRVVSVLVRDNHASNVNHWGNPWPDGVPKVLSHTIETERLPADAYRAPTDEELAAFEAAKKARKAAQPKAPPCPLINPTDEDAERLQETLNERAREDHCRRHLKAYGRDYADQFKPSSVCRITQATYSANSKGSYARTETRGLCRNMEMEPRASNMYSSHEKAEEKRRGPKVCEVRTTSSDGSDYGARRVIVLTDKPQKPFPAAVWSLPKPEAPAFELVAE